ESHGAGTGRFEGRTFPARTQRDRGHVAVAAADHRQELPLARDLQVLDSAATLIRPPAGDAATPGPLLQVVPGQLGPTGIRGTSLLPRIATSGSRFCHAILLRRDPSGA